MSNADLAVLAALPAELAPLTDRFGPPVSSRAGTELFEGSVHGLRIRAAVGGVGKVAAARAAAVLIEPAPRLGLLVVGVCGGLAPNQSVGTLVHCSRAAQIDLKLPWDTDAVPDPGLLAAWRGVVEGPQGPFLTADRAAITPWRRLARRARYGQGGAVTDMETAAAAWVAQSAGVPWAALRAVSDTQGLGALRSFKRHFPQQAPRAAASVLDLAEVLADRSAPRSDA